MKFEWTPRLKEIFSWGPVAHPYLGPQYARENPPFEHYEPGMPLPDPTDYFTFLQWCGLRDEMIHEVSEKYHEENKNQVVPSCGYATELEPAGFHSIHFPILEGMVYTYFKMLPLLDFDYENSYGKSNTILTLCSRRGFSALLIYCLYSISLEGYVKKAIQRGLRPEFAIFCGLPDEDPQAKQDLRHLTGWYAKDPMHYMETRVGSYSILLTKLMRDKLIYEGKVEVDKHRNDSIVPDPQETEKEGKAADNAIE